mmetsp:Transcript_32031/g.81611  ORF Transcript_32031/g.81611 Transcript_32031/m.81611 type:complete len:373 (-) Transcript_32031:94-1212(-)
MLHEVVRMGGAGVLVVVGRLEDGLDDALGPHGRVDDHLVVQASRRGGAVILEHGPEVVTREGAALAVAGRTVAHDRQAAAWFPLRVGRAVAAIGAAHLGVLRREHEASASRPEARLASIDQGAGDAVGKLAMVASLVARLPAVCRVLGPVVHMHEHPGSLQVIARLAETEALIQARNQWMHILQVATFGPNGLRFPRLDLLLRARLGTAVSGRVVQLLDEPLEAGGLRVEPRRRLLAPPLLRQPILHVLITHDPEQALWVASSAVRLPATLLPMHDLRAVLDGEPTGDLPLGDLADFLRAGLVAVDQPHQTRHLFSGQLPEREHYLASFGLAILGHVHQKGGPVGAGLELSELWHGLVRQSNHIRSGEQQAS